MPTIVFLRFFYPISSLPNIPLHRFYFSTCTCTNPNLQAILKNGQKSPEANFVEN